VTTSIGSRAVRSSPPTTIHYHADETTFEIFARGIALITDTGTYSDDGDDPFTIHEALPSAHNVLVVDGDDRVPKGPSPASRIVASRLEPELSWVQGTHDHFADLGIERLVRTFAYAKPDDFAVVDHVRSDGNAHDYAQHFHLHPSLTRVDVIGDRAVVARGADDASPWIALVAAATPDSIELLRGGEAPLRGWYFPALYQKQPATEIVLAYRRADVAVDLPVVIVIGRPGTTPSLLSGLTYVERDGAATLTWTSGGRTRQVTVPSP